MLRPNSGFGSWSGARPRTSALPYPPSRSSDIVAREAALGNLPQRTSRLLPSRTGLFQLTISFVVDHFLQSMELVGRRDVAQGAMQPYLVIFLDKGGDTSPRVINIVGASGTYALAF